MAAPDSLVIRSLCDDDRRQIAGWRYGGDLAIYDPGPGAAQLRAPDHVALADREGVLVAYGTFGPEAQVPGGRYDTTAVDVGVGLRPDLVGRGWGEAAVRTLIAQARARQAGEVVRATVAAVNGRATALMRTLGFRPAHHFERGSDRRRFVQFEHDTLSDRVAGFIRDGYWVLRDAIAPPTLHQCQRDVVAALAAEGVDAADPRSWTRPVVRLDTPRTAAMGRVGNDPQLLAIVDRLLGPGRRIPRAELGGTLPVRFPSVEDPGDASWHIEGSYDVGGQRWANVFSRTRGLVLLVLFDDVDDDSAPTELIAGSHLDVPRVLLPYGEAGTDLDTALLPDSTWRRLRVNATGAAGDIFICHPFLVRRATWPHTGARPRALALPVIAHAEPFALQPRADLHPVEHTIVTALRRPSAGATTD